MTPLTVPEARAILRADEALDATFAQREALGLTLNLDEGAAWQELVKAARDRVATFEKGRPRG